MNELLLADKYSDLFKRYTSTHNIELGNQQEAKNMKLIDHKEEELWTGTILRFKGKYPFEEIVDFMLVSIPWVESGFVFVCISGYHAGQIELCLPNEAKVSTHSISRSWL